MTSSWTRPRAVNRLNCLNSFSGSDGVSISEISAMLKSVLSAAARWETSQIHIESCCLWLHTLSRWNLLIVLHVAEFNLIKIVLSLCRIIHVREAGHFQGEWMFKKHTFSTLASPQVVLLEKCCEWIEYFHPKTWLKSTERPYHPVESEFLRISQFIWE